MLTPNPAAMKPSETPLGYYTHIFYSSALIDPKTFYVADLDADVASHYDEVTALKREQPGLEVWIAIGMIFLSLPCRKIVGC